MRLDPGVMLLRQNATRFISLAPSVMITSLSSSLPNPLSVGVDPVPLPTLMIRGCTELVYGHDHAPSASLPERVVSVQTSLCMILSLATYMPSFSSTAIELLTYSLSVNW